MELKEQLRQLLREAMQTLSWDSEDLSPSVVIEETRHANHGDFASNIAMVLARRLKQSPWSIAQAIQAHLPKRAWVLKTELAKPGFINFFLTKAAFSSVIGDILDKKDRFGSQTLGQGKRVHIDLVSANPTGPLHVGHGRGAAYGSAVGHLLEFMGFDVHREYYLNDAGRQMDLLALSLWLRYVALGGESIVFPDGAYQGDYVVDTARAMKKRWPTTFHRPSQVIYHALPDPSDKEAYLDGLINNAKTCLKADYRILFHFGLEAILSDIAETLRLFRVDFDHWFRESSTIDSGKLDAMVNQLTQLGYTYEQDGAVWFRSTAFDDEKDRVLLRKGGRPTYFAADAAYHQHKYERGFHRMLDIFGADHHGYLPRMRAFIKAIGHDDTQLISLSVQFVSLFRGKERLAMSTRSGEFVSLRELIQEVGTDAARFFYLLNRIDQPMDFDLALACSKSRDNPVYTVQYAHARIGRVLEKQQDQPVPWKPERGLAALDTLDSSYERALTRLLNRYPSVVQEAALSYAPHGLAHYLHELAQAFHRYYSAQPFLTLSDVAIRDAKLALLVSVKQVISTGLALLGVNAPERM